MNIQTIAVGLVGLLVAVLVVGLVAVPVLEDSMEGTPYEGTNTPVEKFAYMGESPNFTIVRAGDTMTITVNGVTETMPYTECQFPVLSNGLMVRNTGAGTSFYNTNTQAYFQSTQPDTVTVTIACVDGTVTVTNNASTPLNQTVEISDALVRSNNGDWGSYTGQMKATLGQKVLFGQGPFNGQVVGPARLYSAIDGEYTELVSPFLYSGSTVTAETVTLTVNYDEQGGLQAVGVYDGAPTVHDGNTYASKFWAPMEFESTSTTEGDVNTVLLGLVPVLLFITAIMIAVRLVKDA